MPNIKNILIITVGSSYGHPQSFRISALAQTLCPLLSTFSNGTCLPRTHIRAFRLILSYLSNAADGSNTIISALHLQARHTPDILLFAQTWTLAGRLHLPELQDKLVLAMRTLYCSKSYRIPATNADTSYPSLSSPPHLRNDAPDQIASAFRHLKRNIGPDSHAERFLICFVARLVSEMRVLDLEVAMLYQFEQRIMRAIVAVMRSKGPDDIVYGVDQFLVSAKKNLPVYPPLEIQRPLTDRKAMEEAKVTARVVIERGRGHEGYAIAAATATTTAEGGSRCRPFSGRYRNDESIRPCYQDNPPTSLNHFPSSPPPPHSHYTQPLHRRPLSSRSPSPPSNLLANDTSSSHYSASISSTSGSLPYPPPHIPRSPTHTYATLSPYEPITSHPSHPPPHADRYPSRNQYIEAPFPPAPPPPPPPRNSLLGWNDREYKPLPLIPQPPRSIASTNNDRDGGESSIRNWPQSISPRPQSPPLESLADETCRLRSDPPSDRGSYGNRSELRRPSTRPNSHNDPAGCRQNPSSSSHALEDGHRRRKDPCCRLGSDSNASGGNGGSEGGGVGAGSKDPENDKDGGKKRKRRRRSSGKERVMVRGGFCGLILWRGGELVWRS